MQSIADLVQQSKEVLQLLDACKPYLRRTQSRLEYCQKSAESLRRCCEILNEIQENKFEINIAFFSTKPGVGKSYIINSLTTNIDGVPAKSSSAMEGEGVTNIPTRYRYGRKKQYMRHYLNKEQLDERISLYPEYHSRSDFDISFQEHFSNGPVRKDITAELSNTDFFTQVKLVQAKTSFTELFYILYDEIVYPFPLIETAAMKYSLLDLPGYRDGKSDFRFCQLYACLRYCNIHSVAGISYGTAGRGRPEQTDLQLLLALRCFESNTSTNMHPPIYMHLINPKAIGEEDYNEQTLNSFVNEGFLEAFGLVVQQSESRNSQSDYDEITTRANRSLAGLENRFNHTNLEHVEKWNDLAIGKLINYLEESQQQLLSQQALKILAELSVPLDNRLKAANMSERRMRREKAHFNEIIMLQRSLVAVKLDEIMTLSKNEYEAETGDDTAALIRLYDLLAVLMIDIAEALAKCIDSDSAPTNPLHTEFVKKHYLSEKCKANLKDFTLHGKSVAAAGPTSAQYILQTINQLTDYVERQYRLWNESRIRENVSSQFLEMRRHHVRRECERLLDDFIARMKELHPFNINTEFDGNVHQLSRNVEELQERFWNKLRVKNLLQLSQSEDEDIKINIHQLPTPKRYHGLFSIPDGKRYESLKDCTKFVHTFEHNEFATLQRRERESIPVVLENLEKWFCRLPLDIQRNTIIMKCKKTHRKDRIVGISYLQSILCDKSLKPFQEIPKDGQELLKSIPPVFIPTYPRYAKLTDNSQITEEIPPIEYLEILRSLDISKEDIQHIVFVVFEDSKDHKRLQQYHRKYGTITNVYFIVLEHDVFNLDTVRNMGIGRKRTFIQLAAEYFKFPFFAVIDDDMVGCEEFSPIHHQNIHDEHTIFRSLNFLRKLLLTEIFSVDNDALIKFKRLVSSEVAKFALRNASADTAIIDSVLDKISETIVEYAEKMEADVEKRPIIAWEMMHYLSSNPEIASLASRQPPGRTLASALKDKFNLFKNYDHIGTAALVNRSSTFYAPLYRRLQNFGKTTHIISSMIYQFVMYRTDAISGLYHVDHDVFFSEDYLSHQDRAQLMKRSRGPDDANGQKLMELGYKHEDKYHHRQLLLHGVTGFQVYWYSIQDNQAGSLVNGNTNSFSAIHGQTEALQSSDSGRNPNDANAGWLKRRRNDSSGESQSQKSSRHNRIF